MLDIRTSYTKEINFYQGHDPFALLKEYGSPLYVYNENVLRRACREMKGLLDHEAAVVCYSAKANTNPHLLRIVREEGLAVDAMSPGELAMNQAAGFTRAEITYVCNNVSGDELALAAREAHLVSVDSLAQLEEFGRRVPGGEVMIRVNPERGAGHHAKVITAGKNTKFGINPEYFGEARSICARHGLKIVGLNQHLGSLIMEPSVFLQAMQWMLSVAEEFEEARHIDFGGGFGIPYHKYAGEPRLDIAAFRTQAAALLRDWTDRTGYRGTFAIEPGRYVAAECGLCLGTVTAVKNNGPVRYVGTDIGFNILPRPMLYGSFHDVEIYGPSGSGAERPELPQTIVGNICESGDILQKDYPLPEIRQGDVVGFLDAGAYCYAMASSYNQRVRPAEVLIRSEGSLKVIRRRESVADIMSMIPPLD